MYELKIWVMGGQKSVDNLGKHTKKVVDNKEKIVYNAVITRHGV